MRKVILAIFLVLLSLIIIIFLGELIFQRVYPFPQNVKYGVTFSPKFATALNMDWKRIYIKILDDLKPKSMRLPTYWDTLQPDSSKYDFSGTDFMLDEAQKRGVKLVLTLGERQYRWPECYIPSWAKNLTVKDRQQKILEFIKTVVDRYKSQGSINAWEVENEPLLSSFGSGCDKVDKNFLKQEVDLVRFLDKRPIILTDSGELGVWVTPMKLSDIFGTTIYRTVYDKHLGFFSYPFLPYFYNLKSDLVKSLFAQNNQKTIIIELQAEPWSPNNGLVNTPVDQQKAWFSVNNFKDNINFAKRTGFDEVYLWGVEWWYFMESKGDASYLNYAKSLFP